MTAGATGGCLCGAVRYRIAGRLREVMNCHCSQCRRTHGHFAAYAAVRSDRLELTEEHGLAWYESSPKAARGFCRSCGASLFWRPGDLDYVAVAAGTLDAPTGLKTVAHIHVADKGDYYEISDDLPQHAAGAGATKRQEGLS